MLNNYGVGFTFGARDVASGAMSRLQGNVQGLASASEEAQRRFTKAMRGMMIGGAMIAGGVKMTQGINRSVTAFADYDATMRVVGRRVKATTKDLKGMRTAVIEAGIETKFTPKEAAVAMDELTRAGFKARKAMMLLKPTLVGATASFGELTPKEMAGLVNQGIKGFGQEAGKADVMVGKLVHSVNSAWMNFKQLSLGLGYVGSGAKTVNQTFDESLIALSMVKDAYSRMEISSNALRTAMERLARSKVRKVLKGVKVDALDANNQFRPFLDVMIDLSKRWDSLSLKKRESLMRAFGLRGWKAVTQIVATLNKKIEVTPGVFKKGAGAVAAMRESMAKAGKTAEQLSEEYLAGMKGKTDLLKGSMGTLQIAVGKLFVRLWQPAAEGVTKQLNKLLRWMRDLSPSAQKFISYGVMAVGVALKLGGALKIIMAIRMMRQLSGISSQLQTATAAMGGMAAASGGAAAAGRAMTTSVAQMPVVFDSAAYSSRAYTAGMKAGAAATRIFAATLKLGALALLAYGLYKAWKYASKVKEEVKQIHQGVDRSRKAFEALDRAMGKGRATTAQYIQQAMKGPTQAVKAWRQYSAALVANKKKVYELSQEVGRLYELRGKGKRQRKEYYDALEKLKAAEGRVQGMIKQRFGLEALLSKAAIERGELRGAALGEAQLKVSAYYDEKIRAMRTGLLKWKKDALEEARKAGPAAMKDYEKRLAQSRKMVEREEKQRMKFLSAYAKGKGISISEAEKAQRGVFRRLGGRERADIAAVSEEARQVYRRRGTVVGRREAGPAPIDPARIAREFLERRGRFGEPELLKATLQAMDKTMKEADANTSAMRVALGKQPSMIVQVILDGKQISASVEQTRKEGKTEKGDVKGGLPGR